MPSHDWPDGGDILVPIPRPPRAPESPLLMGVNIAAALVFVGLLVHIGRALIA